MTFYCNVCGEIKHNELALGFFIQNMYEVACYECASDYTQMNDPACTMKGSQPNEQTIPVMSDG